MAERASVLRATRIVGSGPVSGVKLGDVMIGVVADGGVQTGCARLGRVSSGVCCWAIARGRTSDCTSSKAITLRIMRILLQTIHRLHKLQTRKNPRILRNLWIK